MSPLVIGVTGGIASGKSTILSTLAECGFQVASADTMARDVIQGPSLVEFLSSHGLESRESILNRMKESATFRRDFNRLMHPPIVAAMQDLIDRTREPLAIEVPLLIEAGLGHMFHEVWVADCHPGVQELRLAFRPGGSAVWAPVLALQALPAARNCFADVIVRTNGPVASVKSIIVANAAMCWERWLHRP